jgi:hypothetical protein
MSFRLYKLDGAGVLSSNPKIYLQPTLKKSDFKKTQGGAIQNTTAQIKAPISKNESNPNIEDLQRKLATLSTITRKGNKKKYISLS